MSSFDVTTTNVPYVLIAVVFVVDVLYVTNALYIRSLRNLIDKDFKIRQAQKKLMKKGGEGPKYFGEPENLTVEQYDPDEVQEQPDGHHPTAGGHETPEEARKESQKDMKWTPKSKTKKFVIRALLFNSVSRDHTVGIRFPFYEPIPYKLGVVLTQVLILGSAALLSPQIVGDSFTSPTDTEGLCSNVDKLTKLQEFKDELDATMNTDQATDQYTHAAGLLEALQNDTALYGTEYEEDGTSYDFTCATASAPYEAPGEKEDYNESEYYDAFGPFYPGYCTAYLEGNRFDFLTATCEEKKCVEPDASLFGDLGEAAIKSKIVELNLQVCLTVAAPCPDLTAADDVESTSTDYSILQLDQAATANSDIDINDAVTLSSADDNGYETTETTASAVVEKLVDQVDTASNLYVVYSCFALFFPPPINLFKAPWEKVIKNIFLGRNKFVFILAFVGIWWGVEYYKDLLFNPNVKLYIDNSIKDPCYLDSEFLYERQQYFTDQCSAVTTMGPAFDNAVIGINNILDVGEYWFGDEGECCGFFPSIYSASYTDDATYEAFDENRTYIEEMGFTENRDDMCLPDSGGCNDLTYPSTDAVYVGDTTICEDEDEAKSLIYAASDSTGSWAEIWLQSGLLATFLVKFFVANFGLNLLYVADPLIKHGGRYEYPDPKRYRVTVPLDFDDIREEKEKAIRADAIKGIIVNGIFANACIANLIWLTWSDLDNFDYTDPQILLATCVLLLGALLVIASLVGMARVKTVEKEIYVRGRIALKKGRVLRILQEEMAKEQNDADDGGVGQEYQFDHAAPTNQSELGEQSLRRRPRQLQTHQPA